MPRIFDLNTLRRRLRIRGADRTTFLHGQCTNDIKRLRLGDHCYAAFLNPKGKMRGDGDIVCLEDCFLISSHADLQPTLERYIITEDVTIEDVTAELPEFALWDETPPADAIRYDNRLGGWNVIGLRPAGEPLSAEEFERMRIEAGVPLWGVDLTENVIPIEAGLERWAISYEKGCYIGQETIARIRTYGHVNRHLCQLAGAQPPARDAVTSLVWSPSHNRYLALAYLRRELAKPGTTVTVGGVSMEVLKLCGS
ncbi:MAG: hypothetical protein NZ483_03115 [Verrucomicrobiae bacterium]|nr:hypothetical protein [Verrucomicrobiae bacterium]